MRRWRHPRRRSKRRSRTIRPAEDLGSLKPVTPSAASTSQGFADQDARRWPAGDTSASQCGLRECTLRQRRCGRSLGSLPDAPPGFSEPALHRGDVSAVGDGLGARDRTDRRAGSGHIEITERDASTLVSLAGCFAAASLALTAALRWRQISRARHVTVVLGLIPACSSAAQ